MNRPEDLKTNNTIVVVRRATGGVSGSTSVIGAHKALVRFVHGSTTGSTNWGLRHASASTTLFASATAFTVAQSLSMATSGQKAILVDLVTCKGYLVVKQSTISVSSTAGVIIDLFYNRTIPPSTTGFNALTLVTP